MKLTCQFRRFLARTFRPMLLQPLAQSLIGSPGQFVRNPNKQTNKLPPRPPKTRSWTPSHPSTFSHKLHSPAYTATCRFSRQITSPTDSSSSAPLTPPTPLPRRCYATRSSCTWQVTRLQQLLPLPCHPPTLPPAQMGPNVLQITPTNHLRYLEATLLQLS